MPLAHGDDSGEALDGAEGVAEGAGDLSYLAGGETDAADRGAGAADDDRLGIGVGAFTAGRRFCSRTTAA